MELRAEALHTLDATRRFFDRTLSCLDEADSGRRVAEGTMSVAAHVAHAAQVIDWFREGCFQDRWNLDFPAQQAVTDAVTSLGEARTWLDRAWERLRTRVDVATDAELAEPIADNPILPGSPRFHVVAAVVDHCAHHRGALAVLARLAGKVPPMPYADDEAAVAVS